MKLSYRNQKNAEATAAFWGKPLDRPDWFKITAVSDDETEIMVYDPIGWPWMDATELIRAIDGATSPILVRINSPGGDVWDAMAVYNALASCKKKVTTRIESLAASAASFIALAGKEVQAYQNAMMMIHNSLVFAAGNQYELREVADILEKIDSNMVDIYAGRSDVGKREVAQMMKDETWMNAKEMKAKGFIDTILDGKASARATFDLSMFAHLPDEFTAQTHDHEPTEREIEKLLRDGGVSNRKAKAILAGCRKVEAEAEQSGQMETIRNSLDGLLATIQAAA